MNLTEMRTIVRRELHDEEAANYRWTDNELDRHIAHAIRDFFEALPLEQKATIPTTSGSREIDISSLSARVGVEAVEYPVDKFPKRYQRFGLWRDTLTLLGDEVPDGANAYIYYGKLHTLDALPTQHEDLIATGSCGYAAVTDAAVEGVTGTPEDLLTFGRERLKLFRSELKRLGRRNRVRVRSLYELS